MSTFGQIQFEINSGNQEGMRKIEKMGISKIRIPDMSRLDQYQLGTVIDAFDRFNFDDSFDFVSGEEPLLSNPRNELDCVISDLLLNYTEFVSSTEMVCFYQNFLRDLVLIRRGER